MNKKRIVWLALILMLASSLAALPPWRTLRGPVSGGSIVSRGLAAPSGSQCGRPGSLAAVGDVGRTDPGSTHSPATRDPGIIRDQAH